MQRQQPPSRDPFELRRPSTQAEGQSVNRGGVGDVSLARSHDFPGQFSDPRVPSLYAPHHDLGSVSPVDSSSIATDLYRTSSPGTAAIPPTQLTTMMMPHAKRAYRQRRKDPSCDACRERKVKCDATETTSCTECSSRNVRCQFTKDTNRRMSSIKQVQDLERQLFETRQQLERIRSLEQPSEALSLSESDAGPTLTELPPVGRSPRRMLKSRTSHDLSNARIHLSDVGRGLLKPPVTAVHHRQVSGATLPLAELPARHQAEQYLQAYFECVHSRFPIVHWSELCQEMDSIYQERDKAMVVRENLALLFAVLACGSLHLLPPRPMEEGQRLLSSTVSLISVWEDDASIAQALVAFLISFFLAEHNRRSASLIWHGSAVRIAQNLGLHVQGGEWSPVEGEMRKRIWYSLYTWDRVLAIEFCRPMVINDDECDTEYPETLEEEAAESSDSSRPVQPTVLLATIHLTRLHSPLARLFRSLCITHETLGKFEMHLRGCLDLFPPSLQLFSNSPLDPCAIAPLIHLQNTRLVLHRHNISPSCTSEQRHQAIFHCVEAAQQTASIISRCIPRGATEPDRDRRFVASAPSFLCTHLWRCMLFLLFGNVYDSFSIILRAAALIGDFRVVNTNCGRYLEFFMQCLLERYEQGAAIDLEQDEDLLVYLSGDLQAGTNSWVWGNAETGTFLSRRQKHGRPRQSSQRSPQSSTEGTSAWDSVLSTEEQQSWGGWHKLELVASRLRELYDKAQPVAYSGGETRSLQVPVSHTQRGEPPGPVGSRPKTVATQQEINRSRMNIANII